MSFQIYKTFLWSTKIKLVCHDAIRDLCDEKTKIKIALRLQKSGMWYTGHMNHLYDTSLRLFGTRQPCPRSLRLYEKYEKNENHAANPCGIGMK